MSYFGNSVTKIYTTQKDYKPVLMCVHCCQIPIYVTEKGSNKKAVVAMSRKKEEPKLLLMEQDHIYGHIYIVDIEILMKLIQLKAL